MEWILFSKNRKELEKNYALHGLALEKLQVKLDSLALSDFSDDELTGLWDSFLEAIVDFQADAMLVELANYGGEKILESQLKKELSNESNVKKAMQVLTAPEALSFYQQEEIELAESRDFVAHAKKFSWLKNSYSGPMSLSTDFFQKRKEKLSSDIHNDLKKHLENAKAAKQDLQQKLKLSDHAMNIGRLLAKGIVWQDDRKKRLLQAISDQDRFLDEMALRRNWKKKDALNFSGSEIRIFFEEKKVAGKDLAKRKKGFTTLLSSAPVILGEKDTKELWGYYLGSFQFTESARCIVTGVVASTGTQKIVRGKVRILLDPHRLDQMKEGEVLVAPMTSPEYVFAMKKSVAIVTDTGGLTSHAAIVSRELGKPCVVGTKGATTVFKTGDLIEINTETGTVTRID